MVFINLISLLNICFLTILFELLLFKNCVLLFIKKVSFEMDNIF